MAKATSKGYIGQNGTMKVIKSHLRFVQLILIFNFADEYDKIAPLFKKQKAKRKDKSVV